MSSNWGEITSSTPNNPWHKPISNITWGFLLTIMTFNIFNLKYVLSTIGVALLFLGFYDLRKINKELHAAWIFSIINLFFHVFNLIYLTTPLHTRFNHMGAAIFLSTVFQVTFLFIFRRGINKIFQEAAAKPYKDPLLWLIIWRIVIVLCAITPLGRIWFVALPIICCYLYNLSSLYTFGDLLSQINFTFFEIDSRRRRKLYFAGYLFSCMVIVILSSSLSNHIEVESMEFVEPEISEIGQSLISMGFPEDILKDVSDEEIAFLEDAVNVEVYSELLMFDHNRQPGKNNLEVTSIYVEIDNTRDESTMYSFQYFQWKAGGAYWRDAIKVSGSVPLELIGGRLLYEKDGVSYLAQIPKLKNEIVSETDWFGYENHLKTITGAVSYPFKSDNQRGYIFYKLRTNKDFSVGGNSVNYTHYNHPVRIPYKETEVNSINFSDNSRQVYTNFRRKLIGVD